MSSGSDLHVAVLCGGHGRRLAPLTDSRPKPLVEVRGKPMLDHILEFYHAQGVRRFTLCVGYKGEMIRAHYTPPRFAGEIGFSDTGENTSMLGRLWALREQVTSRFILAYGDHFVDLNIDALMRRHTALGTMMTMVVAKYRYPFGMIRSAPDGLVTSFEEKPVFESYIGCLVAEPEIFSRMTTKHRDLPDGQGLVALFQALIAAGEIGAYEHDGVHLSFNTEEERRHVETELARLL